MPKLTQTTASRSSTAYRDDAYPGGLASHEVAGRDPERSFAKVGKVTATTGNLDSHAYAEASTPGGLGHAVNYGVSPEDMARARECHGAFDSALDVNVNGRTPNRKISQNGYLGEISHNPSVSEKQREFMGAELARKRAGQATETNMSETQLRHFARKPRGKRK